MKLKEVGDYSAAFAKREEMIFKSALCRQETESVSVGSDIRGLHDAQAS
jgi:hypothetical protein